MGDLNVQGKLNRVEMKTGTLFMILFATCCGGCFGIESMVSTSGPGVTFAAILIVPVIWAIPIGLVCSELGTALPTQGGYYVWVKRGLGDFWAYCAGFWRTLLYCINCGVFVVLAMQYIDTFLGLSGAAHYIVAVCLVLLVVGANLVGIKMIGIASTIFTIMIFVPFIGLIVMGFFHMDFNPLEPFFNPDNTPIQNLGYAIALGIWMFGSFESAGTYAGEISNFKKIFPKALLLTALAMIFIYFVPTMIGLSAIGNWNLWGAGTADSITIVTAAKAIGGPLLGTSMMVAAMLSNVIMDIDLLASLTRIPYIMAEDGIIPKSFAKLHKKFKTPTVSICFCGVIMLIAVFCGSFSTLVKFQTFLFFITYVMALSAAIALRIKEPALERPFRIPGGTKALVLICMPVFIISAASLLTNGWITIIGAIAAIILAPVTYWIFKKTCKDKKHRKPSTQ
jgi:amino acid transporter